MPCTGDESPNAFVVMFVAGPNTLIICDHLSVRRPVRTTAIGRLTVTSHSVDHCAHFRCTDQPIHSHTKHTQYTMSDDNTTDTPTRSSSVPDAITDNADLFREQMIKPVVAFTIGLFGLLGLSIGVTSAGVLWIMLEGSGFIDAAVGYLIALMILLLLLVIGSVVAAFVTQQGTVAIGAGRRLEEKSMVLAGSCYVGMVLMTTVAFIFVRAPLPSIVATEFGFGRIFMLSMVVAIPVAAVGAGVVWLDEQFLSEHADRGDQL